MATFNYLNTNGLADTYVAKDGNDITGSGTTALPYASIAKATSVAASGSNIILGNGVWEEQRTLNSRVFKWYGCGNTIMNGISVKMTTYTGESYININFYLFTFFGSYPHYSYFYNCKIENCSSNNNYGPSPHLDNCLIINSSLYGLDRGISRYVGNVFVGSNTITGIFLTNDYNVFKHNIINGTISISYNTNVSVYTVNYNNYTTNAIPITNGANINSINNASTGQTVTDYFNNTAIGDYTAKVGSANLQAGEYGADIGFSRGYPLSATVLYNAATIKTNIDLVNGIMVLNQRNLAVVSAADSTHLIIDSSASSTNDEYKDLYIRITAGLGAGQIKPISAYNGTTKEITVGSAWSTTPDSTSRYSISGHFKGGKHDLGSAFKIKKNWLFALFAYNITTLTGKYNQYPAFTNNDAIADNTFYDFQMKYSVDDYVWSAAELFQWNGKTMFDGTYGDGDNSYTPSSGNYPYTRYINELEFKIAV